jgi:hypothetical protein
MLVHEPIVTANHIRGNGYNGRSAKVKAAKKFRGYNEKW